MSSDGSFPLRQGSVNRVRIATKKWKVLSVGGTQWAESLRPVACGVAALNGIDPVDGMFMAEVRLLVAHREDAQVAFQAATHGCREEFCGSRTSRERVFPR